MKYVGIEEVFLRLLFHAGENPGVPDEIRWNDAGGSAGRNHRDDPQGDAGMARAPEVRELLMEAHAPFGGLLRVRVLDTSMALHRDDAACIMMKEKDAAR